MPPKKRRKPKAPRIAPKIRPPPKVKPVDEDSDTEDDIPPCEWEKVDQADGTQYFWNATTQESTYEEPWDYTVHQQQKNEAAIGKPHSDWQRLYDGDTPYYFNAVSSESVYQPPFEVRVSSNKKRNAISTDL
jgi:hypothetical protein